jgi:hypothetical protein
MIAAARILHRLPRSLNRHLPQDNMAVLNLLLGLAFLAAPSIQHTAIMPPLPDRALTPKSMVAPAGCKLLLCDKSWPADSVWKAKFPGIFKKLKGSLGPDFMIQAKNVEDVQKAVNFARDHNIRLTVITAGHDFHGRYDGLIARARDLRC